MKILAVIIGTVMVLLPALHANAQFTGLKVADAKPGDVRVIATAAIRDPLNAVLKLDTFTIFVGPESADVRVRKRIAEHPRLDVVGLASIGFTNRSSYEARLPIKLHDFVFFDAQIQHVTQGTETEEEVLTRGRLQLRLHYRLPF